MPMEAHCVGYPGPTNCTEHNFSPSSVIHDPGGGTNGNLSTLALQSFPLPCHSCPVHTHLFTVISGPLLLVPMYHLYLCKSGAGPWRDVLEEDMKKVLLDRGLAMDRDRWRAQVMGKTSDLCEHGQGT